jgi:enterochelin esterase-like enzyme
MGTKKPVAVLQHGTTAADIVNLAAITAVMADLGATPAALPDREPALAR